MFLNIFLNTALAKGGAVEVGPSLGFSDALFFIVLYFVAVILAGFLGWKLIRLWFQYTHFAPQARQMTILKVLLPRAGRQEIDKQDALQVAQEKIGVAESFYSVIGGMRPEKGWRKFIFGRSDHLSLEMVVHDGLIHFYLAVPKYMERIIEEQIHAQYPNAHIEESEDYNIFLPRGVSLGAYLKLQRPSAFPIKTYKDMESDPMNALTNTMSKIHPGDGVSLQFIVRSAHRSWRKQGIKIATEMQQGKKLEEVLHTNFIARLSKAPLKILGALFQGTKNPEEQVQEKYQLSPMEAEMVKGLENKASKAGLDVNIRVVVSSKNIHQAQSYLSDIVNAFSQYSIYQYGNRFRMVKPLFKRYFFEQFIYREFNERYKFVLNTEELASVYHFPLPIAEAPNIEWLEARKAAPPVNLPKEGIILGRTEFRGDKKIVRIKRNDRRRHVYIIGRSGSGKSVLMENMAIQDIRNGDGIGVIDPAGDFIEHLLPYIPKERAEDVIIFNPSDIERPIGLNMLEAKTPEEMDFAVQEMISIFYKLVPNPDMIGPMFEHNMRNAMLTLMANPKHPGTLADIPRMFTDPAFQRYSLQFVKDPMVRAFWEKEMAQTSDQTKSEMLGYLISKVGRFVENEMVRNIIGQAKSGFDFQDVMDNKKILLVNLAKGTTGEVNANLLGMILVAKLQMAAFRRASMPEEKRNDFYLYIDEFQNFTTDSIATILSEARKYRLNLTIAHQFMSQLVKNNDSSIRDAVLGNAGTMVVFRIGVEDAEVLEKEFEPVFNANDLVNVEKYTAYIKLLIDNTAARPFNFRPDPPIYFEPGNKELAANIVQLSRLKYGRPREEVSREILERTKLGTLSTKSSVSPESTP